MAQLYCKDCKYYQKTALIQYDINDVYFLRPEPLYDCPYADDWCEADDKINTLCNNKFEPKEMTNGTNSRITSLTN